MEQRDVNFEVMTNTYELSHTSEILKNSLNYSISNQFIVYDDDIVEVILSFLGGVYEYILS